LQCVAYSERSERSAHRHHYRQRQRLQRLLLPVLQCTRTPPSSQTNAPAAPPGKEPMRPTRRQWCRHLPAGTLRTFGGCRPPEAPPEACPFGPSVEDEHAGVGLGRSPDRRPRRLLLRMFLLLLVLLHRRRRRRRRRQHLYFPPPRVVAGTSISQWQQLYQRKLTQR
jgi:hypothetical protein